METRTDTKSQSIELGKVTWLRDYDRALAESRREDKPVLLFFQEIPGCSTCVNFGRDVLSHPLMVEFIENEFIPLAIYNNRPGADRDILSLYSEPSWNNPVAHFINYSGQDIIPKLANNYQPLGMYNKMIEVLGKLARPVPPYAILLGEDLKMEHGALRSAIYEASCFWSGETSMALHPAVKYTEAGWIDNTEVVKVFFDQSQASPTELNSHAIIEGLSIADDQTEYKTDESPQYCLSKSLYRHLPLSKAQRSQINVAIAYSKQPEQYLSPKQGVMYQELRKKAGNHGKSDNYKQDIAKSWNWN